MTRLPVSEAAEALDIKPGTLRRWIREGLPHRPGKRGRGHATLVDIDQARRWMGSSLDQQQMQRLADEIPRLMARATFECWRQTEGVKKRALAGVLAANWYMSAAAVLDRLREDCPDVPDISSLPDEIERLRKIGRDN